MGSVCRRQRTGDAHKHRGAVNPCPEHTVGVLFRPEAWPAHTLALLSHSSENREEVFQGYLCRLLIWTMCSPSCLSGLKWEQKLQFMELTNKQEACLIFIGISSRFCSSSHRVPLNSASGFIAPHYFEKQPIKFPLDQNWLKTAKHGHVSPDTGRTGEQPLLIGFSGHIAVAFPQLKGKALTSRPFPFVLPLLAHLAPFACFRVKALSSIWAV